MTYQSGARAHDDRDRSRPVGSAGLHNGDVTAGPASLMGDLAVTITDGESP